MSDTAPPAPAAETDLEAPALAAPGFDKGNLVVHSWDDHYDGPRNRMGIVVEVIPAVGDEPARTVVAWLGDLSGPIDNDELSAV